MAEPEDESPPLLLPCSVCSRTFKPESLQKHLKVCEKQASKKRKVFDSSKQRIQGTELAEFLPKILREKKTEKVVPKKPESNWKEKHLEFVAAIRAARGVEPVPTTTKSSSAVSKSSNEKCPHCDRNFGPKAFDRHIEWCKEQKARIPKSPASLIQAKERLEARTKYRAPPLAKSKRTLTREKYARVSQHSSKDSSPLGSRSAVAFSKPQPQEVKVPEATSRIPGIRNKPKLSSSSPSCTLPGGNTQVKRREPSPSPSKRPFRSGSKTARKGPVKAKNEESSSHASLFTSSCNITKIQPSEERHKAREVKPNPVENRVIARKSSLSMLKPHKRKGDPAPNPTGVGALTAKGDEKTGEWHCPADGIELHEKTFSCETHNSLLGESLQVTGTLTQPDEEEDSAFSDNVKRLRTHGTKQLRIKLNDTNVNKENDGLFVSPCSIHQSNCNVVASKEGSKSKQGLKGRGDCDVENEDCNTTVTPCADDDIQTQKPLGRSVKEKIVSEQHSQARSLKTDTREDECTKFCVDSPRYSSGDTVCQKDIKLQPKKLSPDLPLISFDKQCLKCEEFPSEINKSFDAQENTCCSFMGDGQKTKNGNENSLISELFLSADEVNDQVDFQQNPDYQPNQIDPTCCQEIERRKLNEVYETKEKFEEKVISADFETVISAKCEVYLQTEVDVTRSDKLCTNEGGDNLVSSQVNLLASHHDYSTCLKDKDALTVGNEKLSNEEELCVPLQKFPYSLDHYKNTGYKTDIDCKIDFTGNLESEAQRKCSFVSACNERLNELITCSNQIDTETVDDMGDFQNSEVHHVKERLSQNLKAFDRIFAASECESSDITIAKFNNKHKLLKNVEKTQPVGQDTMNHAIEINILHPDTSSWKDHEHSDILQDQVAKSGIQCESSIAKSDLQSECSEFSQNLLCTSDVYNFSNELMKNNEVSSESVKKEKETSKGEAEDSINTVCAEKFKPRPFQGRESNMPVSDIDKSAILFDVKEHLSLLTDDETQMNVSSTPIFIRAFGETNNTKNNDFVNNSCELNFSQTTNKTSENNLSTINNLNLSEVSLPDISPSLKDENNIKHSLPEGFVRKDSDQPCLEGEDSSFLLGESRFCISHHDNCVKSDNQFSIEHESALIKDSNYNNRSIIPFCKKSCLGCHRKDKIQSEVFNEWSSCEEEEPDLFYKFDLPENIICERFLDSPTDRIWDLASQEFIKNVRKDSCNINSELDIPIESHSFEESNSEESKELIEQHKILQFSNQKRKSIQFKTTNECGSILFRSYFAFHRGKRRGKHLKKIWSSIICRTKKKYRRTSQRSSKKSYNLEEPMTKERLFQEFSIHCEALSDISSKQKSIFRNRTKNESFFNVNNSIQSEESKLSFPNLSVPELDQNSESVPKNMIQTSESLADASNADNSTNETVFTLHNQLHCNSMEENENCTLKTFNKNIVVVEGLEDAENQELVDEALIVALPLRTESETVVQNINLPRITPQNENTIRYVFDVTKFFVMSELLHSGALNSVISMYMHCLLNTQRRIKKQSSLSVLPISDKIQNDDDDDDLKSGSAPQNIPSTIAVFYDIDESLFKENLISTYVVSHKLNETYFSSDTETASFHDDQFLEIDLLPMGNCKDNNELSSDIEEEEYREIKRNSSSGKSNANHEIENISRNKEMNGELCRDMKSDVTDRQAGDEDYEFENEISNHGLSQMFRHRLQNFCEHADTDLSGSQHSVVYVLPTEALPPQHFSYERDEDITSSNVFSEILRGFETPQIRNCLHSDVCCECSQEFVDDLEFDLLHDSSDISHFAFEYGDDNSLPELYPFYSGCANYHSNGVVIKELSEESEEQLSDVDLHQGEDNCKMVNMCLPELNETDCTDPLNVPFAEVKDCLYNFNYFNEPEEDFVEANLSEWIEETDYAQADETYNIQNVELNSTNVSLTPGKICPTSDLAIANVCYHPCELDRLIPFHNRNIFSVNFPTFLYTESDDFDIKIWTSSITIPQKKVSLLTHSFQSSAKKSNGAEDEEEPAKFDFRERLAQNIMVMQQNNDSLFEDINKRVQENDIRFPKRKISASLFKKEQKSTTEKHFNRPLTSETYVSPKQTHGGDMSLYDLARNVKGIIQSEKSKLSEVQTCNKHKIKSAKEHDMSLLKLVEKWSTKDKILKRPKTYEITSKKADKQFVQSKQEVPKIHRLPPLSSPPKCCLQNRTKLPRVPKGRLTQKSTKLRLMFRRAVSSSEEVYDPYVSAERQMMELLSQGDFTQLSPRHNKTIPSSHAESSTVFPSFESSHRSAFVRYSPPDLSHLSNETAIPSSLIAEFEDLFIGSQKSNYINDISDLTDQQNQNIHISLSDIGQNLSNNNVDTVQPVRKPSKIRAKMESAALSLQRSVSLMNYENDMKVGTEASSLIQSDGDNNPLPTLTEISSFPFSSPEPPRVFSSSKSHLEKGDADKRINEEAFVLKSESSVSSELFAQLKSHSAGGKFSADSAYGSLNRRSPTHSTGKQRAGKHEEMEADRLCFMSSSSSESSLPPLCAVQVVKREASNPSLSPSPPHAVDASPVLQSVPRMSKFCHECGSKYPVSLAKFCCECGVRRLAM